MLSLQKSKSNDFFHIQRSSLFGIIHKLISDILAYSEYFNPNIIKRTVLLGLASVTLLSVGSCEKSSHDGDKTHQEWSYYYERRDDPEFLKAELRSKPGNEAILMHLMAHYGRHDINQEKLRQYTLEMVKYHPENSMIVFDTTTSFYIDTDFRDDVIKALEAQIPANNDKAGLFWNLAEIYKHKAIPPFSRDASEKHKRGWFEYFGVLPDTKIPAEINYDLANKSEQYYRKAIKLVEGDEFGYSFYSGHLAELLIKVGRESEAIPIYENAINSTTKEHQCDLYKELGDLYYQQDDYEQARKNYLKAIQTDKLSYEHTGHATTYSYTYLGLMALKEGRIEEAERMLLNSAETNPCCHTTTQGMPLKLAEALVGKGRYEVPKQYLNVVLEKFTPERKNVLELLDKIKGLETRISQ